MTCKSVTLSAGLLGVLSLASSGSAQQAQSNGIQPYDPDITIIQRSDFQTSRRLVDFAVTPNSYVVVIRVGSRGAVDVLYPLVPSVDKALIKSDRVVHVSDLNGTNKRDGTIYGFVSLTPFVFSRVSSDNGWNSFHLANYSGSTDEVIAQTFGSDISSETSRVVMARATPGGPSLVTRGYTQPNRLASFHNKPCPYLARPMGNSSDGGPTQCMIYQMALPGQGAPSQSTQTSNTRQGKTNR